MSDELYIGAMDCSHLIDFVDINRSRFKRTLGTVSIDLAPSEELRLLLELYQTPQLFVYFKREGLPMKCWHLAISQERDNGKGWWITG